MYARPLVYHQLTHLSQRALLDANVVMNAAFVRQSLSARAVQLLSTLGFTPTLDERTHREAVTGLLRLASQTGYTADPVARLDALLAREGVVWVPEPTSAPAVPEVSRHDQHLAAAAVTYDGWILTGDLPLFAECYGSAVCEARLPTDVLFEHATGSGAAPKELLGLLLRYCPPLSLERGSIFARVAPGPWAGCCDIGDFTVVDVEHLGALFYSSERQAWVFELDEGPEVTVTAVLEPGKSEILLANYSRPGKLELRAGSSQHPVTLDVSAPDIWRPLGSRSFGHTRSGGNHFNGGHIQCIVTNDNKVSDKAWKAVRATPFGAPNPWDENTVRAAMRSATA